MTSEAAGASHSAAGLAAFLRRALLPFARGRTYLRAAYLLLGLPLGVAYLVCVTTTLAVSFALCVTLVGVPLVGYALVLSRHIAAFDCWLAERLLGRGLPRPGRTSLQGYGLLCTFSARIRDGEAWRAAGYLALRCPLGALDFAVAVAMLSLFVWGVGNWIFVAAGGVWHFGLPTLGGSGLGMHVWRIDTVGKAVVFVVPGLVVLLVTPHVLNAMASFSGSTIARLVGRLPYRELRSAVVGVLAGGRELDGPAVLAELGLSRGYSADFTAAQVYPVLRGLVDAGLAQVHSGGAHSHYSLAASGAAAAR